LKWAFVARNAPKFKPVLSAVRRVVVQFQKTVLLPSPTKKQSFSDVILKFADCIDRAKDQMQTFKAPKLHNFQFPLFFQNDPLSATSLFIDFEHLHLELI
jgi:hypothetical protein